MLLRFNSFALIPFMMMGMIVRQSRDKKMGGKSLCLQTLKSPSGNSEKSWWHGESIGGSSFGPIHVGHKPRLMASPTEGNICEDTAKHQKLTQRTEELKTNDLLVGGTGRSQGHRDSWLCRCQSWRLACSVHPGCSLVGQTIEAELGVL